MSSILGEKYSKEKFLTIFKQIDVNNSLTIDKEEMGAMMKKLIGDVKKKKGFEESKKVEGDITPSGDVSDTTKLDLQRATEPSEYDVSRKRKRP